MSLLYPIKRYRWIGGLNLEDETLSVVKRAVSFTPTNDMTLRHWSTVIARWYIPRNAANELVTFEWEIRSASVTLTHGPQDGSGAVLASGTMEWDNSTRYPEMQFVYQTFNLDEGLELTAGEEYWFCFASPNGTYNAKHPLAWAETYVDGSAGEVDSTVYCSLYDTNGWAEGVNSYNFYLTVLDEQAGTNWHCVVNGKGYMQPDKMRGWTMQTVSSGLAQSRGGQSEYSQMRYPYSSLSQDGWTSGIGQLAEEDQEAYLYGKTIDTTAAKQAIIGPAMHVHGTNTTNVEYDPAIIMAMQFPYPWRAKQEVPGVNILEKREAQMFTAPAGGLSAIHIGVRARRIEAAADTPWTMYLSIWSNDATGGDHPNEKISTEDGVVYPGDLFEWVDADITSLSLVAGTKYWLVVYTDQLEGAQPKFELMFDTEGTYAGGAAMFSYEDAPAAYTDWRTNETVDGKKHSLAFRLNWGEAGSLNGDVVDFAYGPVNDVTQLYCLAGKKVYVWDETNGYWDASISTGITATYGADADTLEDTGTDLIIFNNKLVVCQGYGYPMRIWDGTNWDYVGTANSVSNSSFTSATTGWTAGTGTALSSVTGGYSGNCLQVLKNAASADFALASQTITVTPETWYTLEYYHKNGTGGTADRVKVGWAVDGTEYYDSGAAGINDATWTKRVVAFKTDVGITSVVITLVGSNTDTKTAFFDEVFLYTTPKGKYMHIGKGYLWASTSRTGVSRTNSLATWTGYVNDEGETSEITVGDTSYEITAFAMYQSRFLVGKEDGIWEIDEATGLAVEYLVFREHAAATNCKGMCVWGGMLFIPVQSSIWRWQGSQYKEVGPADKRTGPTWAWPCRISSMAPTAPFLYAAANPVLTSGFGGIMAYNGMGWHPLATASQNYKTNNAICVVTSPGLETRIWTGQGDKTGYIRLPNYTNNRYDWPSADYDISGGYLATSVYDGGVKDALKYWRSVCVLADIPAYTYIDVFAVANGAEWKTTTDATYIGRLAHDTLTNNNEFVLMFPDGLVAKTMQLVFYLWSEINTATPRLKAYNMETLVRQKPAHAYSFRVLLADNVTKLDKTSETTRNAETMLEELMRSERENAPITVSFPDISIRGSISNLRVETSQFKPDGMNEEEWEKTAILSIVEAS